jgi:hypothetical protein
MDIHPLIEIQRSFDCPQDLDHLLRLHRNVVIKDRHTVMLHVGRQILRIGRNLVRHREIDEIIDARRQQALQTLARIPTRRAGVFTREQLAGIHPIRIWQRRIGRDHVRDELIRPL